MAKIRCHSRKEVKCKQAPKMCKWDDLSQKCSNAKAAKDAKDAKTNITVLRASANANANATQPKQIIKNLAVLEFAAYIEFMTDPVEVVKTCHEFIGKHFANAQVVVNGSEFYVFIKKQPFKLPNPQCVPASVRISKPLTLSDLTRTDAYIKKQIVLQVEYDQVAAIVNAKLIELASTSISVFKTEITSRLQKLNFAKCYFVSDFTSRIFGQDPPAVYFDNDNTMNSIILYDACKYMENAHDSLFDPFGLNLGISFLNCHFCTSNPSLIKPLTFGVEKFEPTSVKLIRHGTYIPKPNIRLAYVNNQGSTELNVSMRLFLNENEKITDDVRDRILLLLNEFKQIAKRKTLYSKPYVVYHGTSQEMHTTHTFVTTSFLSTTRSYKTASIYGSIFYVITVPARFPVINFIDELSQILLPVGTFIKIDREEVIYKSRYIFCHVTDDPIVIDPFIEIFKNPCEKKNSVTLKENTSALNASASASASDMRDLTLLPITLNGSSTFYSTFIGNEKYFVKDIVKRSNKVRVLTSDNQVFKRVFNEVLAAHIYSRVYKLNTLDYTILDRRRDQPNLANASNFLIVSKFETVKDVGLNQVQKNAIYQGFIIDCIMGNWDVYNNTNVGILFSSASKKNLYLPIRTDVGGALAFRGIGDHNIAFRKDKEPQDHILVARQVSFTNLNISSAIMKTSLDYLKSISVATVKSRLKKVQREFAAYIDLVNEKEFAKKYHAMLDGIVEAVIYRDDWYRKNGLAALVSIANRFVAPKTGGSVNDGVSNIVIDDNFDIDIVTTSYAAAASPGAFTRMLARHQQCVMQK